MFRSGYPSLIGAYDGSFHLPMNPSEETTANEESFSPNMRSETPAGGIPI